MKEHWKLTASQTAMQVGAAVRQESFATRATTLRGVNDAMQRAASRAAGLIDAGVHSVANTVRTRALRAGQTKFDGYRWHTILDSSVCPNCGVRAEKVYDLEYRPVGHTIPMVNIPPFHPYCRCMLVPITFVKGAPGKARTDTFRTWLAGRSEDFQEQVLGKGRAALYRANRMSSGALIDQSGLVMSLQELHERGL